MIKYHTRHRQFKKPGISWRCSKYHFTKCSRKPPTPEVLTFVTCAEKICVEVPQKAVASGGVPVTVRVRNELITRTVPRTVAVRPDDFT